MEIKPDQLDAVLAKGLHGVYCLTGEEPFQLGEAADRIRGALRARGPVDRSVFQVGAGFDWGLLDNAFANRPLFGEQQLIEMVLSDARPGAVGARSISRYCAEQPEGVCLMLRCGRMEPAVRQSAWMSAVNSIGVVMQVWPVVGRALETWLRQRLGALDLKPSAEALAVLLERSEGNLLAAAQHIEKLRMLNGPGVLEAALVYEAVGDSARFTTFELGDAVLAGEGRRALRVLDGLREEGTEGLLALWSLTRAVRAVCLARETGDVAGVMRTHKVFGPRQALFKAAVRRGREQDWRDALRDCAAADRVAKGRDLEGDAWFALRRLTIKIAAIGLNNRMW
jgi:DNA polymerase III subunit delta